MPTPPATLIVGLLRLPGPTARARRGCRSQRQDRHPTLCQPFGRPLHCRLLLQRSRRTCGQARNNPRHWRRLRVPPGPSSKRPPSSAQSTDDQPGTADPTHPKPGPSQAVSGMSRTSRANAVPRRTVRSRFVPSRLVPIPAESSCPAISTIGTGVARPSVHFPTSITSSIATPARNLSRSPFRMISEMLALRGDTCCKHASFPVQQMMGILRIGPPCAARPPAAEPQTATAPLSRNSHLFSTHHYQLTTASYNVAQGFPPGRCCPCFAKPATLAAQKPWR